MTHYECLHLLLKKHTAASKTSLKKITFILPEVTQPLVGVQKVSVDMLQNIYDQRQIASFFFCCGTGE